MKAATRSKLAWSFVVVLGVVHYDFWYWSDGSLVLGFMPIGLFFHALISVLAGLAWFLVVQHAWPAHVEDWASTTEADPADEPAGTEGEQA